VNESTVKKLYKKTPSEFMQVFLEYRLLQLAGEKGGSEAGRERARELLKRYPTHPVAPELQAALRGGGAPTRVAGRSMEPPPPLNINKIGCLVPLNGPHEKYGRMVQRGLTVALEDWNKRNPNQTVNLVVKDAPAEGDGALKAFESLAKEEGVAAVIGPLGAQTVKAVAPAAERLGVPMLALTQREDDAPRNMYVLHVFLDNQDLVRSLVRYCRTKLGYTRFASLYPDDRYGQKLSKTFAEVVREEGGNLVTSVTYKEKTTDFKEPLQKLLTVANQNIPPSGIDIAPFEALFIPDQIQTLSLIAPQLPHNNVLGATLLGTNLWAEGALLDVGTNYIEQAVFATPFYAEADTPKSRAFSERFQELYQTPPSYLEAQAYDALMLFLMGRSSLRGGATDRYGILQGIQQVRNFEGLAGTYSFTPEGDLKRNYLIFQVQNGQIVRVAN
jgi:branched-chain amino acid transport system substrate-binding protein